MMHSVIVNGVIEKSGSILVSKRSMKEKHAPGKWTIPGGKVEITAGDVFNVLEDTLRKEIKEEVGVEISGSVQYILNNTFIRNDGTHVIAILFLCRYLSGEPKALEDTSEIQWIKPSQLNDYDFAPNVQKYIVQAFAALDKSA